MSFEHKNQKDLLNKLCLLANINLESKIGAIALADSVRKDLGAASKYFEVSENYLQCAKTLDAGVLGREVTERDISVDLIAVDSSSNLTLKTLVRKPNTIYRSQDKIHAIRGAIIYHLLVSKLRLTHKLANNIRWLFVAKDISYVQLFDSIEFSRASIEKLYLEHQANEKVKTLLSHLLSALSISDHTQNDNFQRIEVVRNDKGESNPIKEQSSEVGLPISESTIEKNTNKTTQKKYQQVHTSGDYLKYKFKKYSSNHRVNLGLANIHTSLHPRELEDFVARVISDFNNNKKVEVQFAILVNLFIGCGIGLVNLIPLYQMNNSSYWIDVAKGQVCMSRNFIISKSAPLSENDIFRIPLPAELARYIHHRNLNKHRAQYLGDLFATNLLELKKQTRQYCLQNSPTTHIVSQVRLSKAYARFLLQQTEDEVYSSLISGDFDLCDTATFSYCRIKADQLNQICSDAYITLGFSGKLYRSVERDIGSPYATQKEALMQMLTAELNNVNHALAKLHTRNSLDDLLEIHQAVTKGVLLLCVVSGCFRASEGGYLAAHQVDLQRKLFLVTDKQTTHYNTWRLVPIPNFVFSWLVLYQHYLQIFGKRLSKHNRRLSQQVIQLSEMGAYAEIPLFFKVKRQNLVASSLATADLKDTFESYKLPTNVARHVFEFQLREKIGSVGINILMGRAEKGQEPFGDRSAISPKYALQSIRSALDKLFRNAALPNPIQFSGFRHRNTQLNIVEKYSTKLARKRLKTKGKNRSHQACPFHEHTLLYAKYFENLADCWHAKGIDCTIADLVFSLVIHDAVVVYDELLATAYQLVYGKAYQAENRFYVDTATARLGNRRVLLSAETVLIAVNIISSDQSRKLDEVAFNIIVVDQTNEFLKQYHLNGYALEPSIRDFLKSAEAFLSCVVPGILRSYLDGKSKARVSRVQTLARHALDRQEPKLSEVEQIPGNRRASTDTAVIALLDNYSSKHHNLGSNKKRTRELLKGISEAYEGLVLEEDQLLARYAVYLIEHCPSIKSPQTVKNYYFNLRKHLCNLPADIYRSGELNESQLTKQLQGQAKSLNQTEVNALNYFLEMYGSKHKVKLVGQKTKAYVEQLSENEILKTKQIINDCRLKPLKKLQAQAMLELMANFAVRAEDATKIRICDVHIGTSGGSYIYITEKSVGTKKTKNANRLLVDDKQKLDQFITLVKLKKQTFPNIKNAAIFSDNKTPTRFKSAETIKKIINDALTAATGSVYIRTHTFRDFIISTGIKSACSIESQTAMSNSAKLMFLPSLSISAGHAHEKTSLDEYCTSFDEIRSEWISEVRQGYKLHPKFLASLINKNHEVVSRTLKNKPTKMVLRESLDKLSKASEIKFVKLDTFTISNSQKLDSISVKNSEVITNVAFAQYIAARACEEFEEVRDFNSNLQPETLSKLKKDLGEFELMMSKTFTSSVKFKSANIYSDEKYTDLNQYFGAVHFSRKEIFMLAHTFQDSINSAWLCDFFQFRTVAQSIFPYVIPAGFDVMVTIASEHKNLINQHTYPAIKWLEVSNKHHFKDNKSIKVVFLPQGTKKEAMPRKMGFCMLKITAYLLSRFSQLVGE